MNIFKQLFGSAETVDMGSIIKEGAYLVDVRTSGEFAGGHVKGSVNIPLDKISSDLAKFKNKKNIIVFCQSGARAGHAKTLLQQNGFTNVVNGGGWISVSQFVK
jgi:phage shock protein E